MERQRERDANSPTGNTALTPPQRRLYTCLCIQATGHNISCSSPLGVPLEGNLSVGRSPRPSVSREGSNTLASRCGLSTVGVCREACVAKSASTRGPGIIYIRCRLLPSWTCSTSTSEQHLPPRSNTSTSSPSKCSTTSLILLHTSALALRIRSGAGRCPARGTTTTAGGLPSFLIAANAPWGVLLCLGVRGPIQCRLGDGVWSL